MTSESRVNQTARCLCGQAVILRRNLRQEGYYAHFTGVCTCGRDIDLAVTVRSSPEPREPNEREG